MTDDTTPSAASLPDETSQTAPKVYAAFAAALQSAKYVGKDDFNQQQNFKFRGIDGTLQVVGPAFRENGLFLIPEVIDHRIEQVQSARGKQMVQVILHMRYTVAHEDGSSFSGTTVGEATDFADKATSKAGSVALRTFLLQSMVLPTGDPDPDSEYHERGQERAPRMMETPGWDPEKATRPQLMQALREARDAGNRAEWEKIREIGNRRFPAHPGTNDDQTPDPVQAAGENQEQ